MCHTQFSLASYSNKLQICAYDSSSNCTRTQHTACVIHRLCIWCNIRQGHSLPLSLSLSLTTRSLIKLEHYIINYFNYIGLGYTIAHPHHCYILSFPWISFSFLGCLCWCCMFQYCLAFNPLAPVFPTVMRISKTCWKWWFSSHWNSACKVKRI